jgi:hypothetical protein
MPPKGASIQSMFSPVMGNEKAQKPISAEAIAPQTMENARLMEMAVFHAFRAYDLHHGIKR